MRETGHCELRAFKPYQTGKTLNINFKRKGLGDGREIRMSEKIVAC